MTAAPTLPTSTTTSKRPLYEGSSQFRHWRFSPEQLNETRFALNEAAVAAIRNIYDADSPGSSSNVSFLTPEEEHLLVKLYIGKISQLCGHFRFPEEVEATAVSFLKRFYLKNTVMDWHPKNVMLTALFLATKTTNHPITLEAYTSHIPKTAPSDVLDLEFLVAQSLGFEFAVWHAHRSLWGMYLDLQTLPDVPIDKMTAAYEAALPLVRASRLTDAELIYTPSQIALASLSLHSPELVAQWAISKDSESTLPILAAIRDMISREGLGPDVDAVRDVDRRLKICKNPEKVPGSKAFLLKKAEEAAKAEEKRARKVEGTRNGTVDGGDPFGDELAEEEANGVGLDDDD